MAMTDEQPCPSVLNKEAISMMQHGKYDSAVAVFTSALQQLTAYSRRFKDKDCEDETSLPLNFSICGVHFSADEGLESKPPHKTSDDRSDSSGRYFVKNPLQIRTNLVLSKETIQALSYTALFNFALTYHLWGLETANDEHLVRAIKIYKVSHSIISSEGVQASSRLFMTLVCNTGHAFFAIGDHFQANKCFHVLLQAVLCIVDGGTHDEKVDEGFIANVIHLILTQQACPAA